LEATMKLPIPLLTFADERGLDSIEFNTIRLGGGWVKRLKKGDRVALATKTHVVATAKVLFVVKGKASEMLALFASANHIERHLCTNEPDYSFEGAPARRMQSLRKVYGPAKFNEDAIVSVIALRTK
jgi:hypothetical protein